MVFFEDMSSHLISIGGRGSELQGRGWAEDANWGVSFWHVKEGVERPLQSFFRG